MTWNIEGVSRNLLNLKHFIDIHHQPDLIFLCEPNVFACNIDLVMKPLADTYKFALNTADKYDPELPLIKSKAHGGTMVMWRNEYDAHVSLFPVLSSAFLPIIFDPPGSLLSIHIAVYLPTLGQEIQFLEDLSKLSIVIEELNEVHPEAPIYLRGDFNVSHSNKKRTELLEQFCLQYELLQALPPKPTYHHFTGDGQSDSFLDRLLFSKTVAHQEYVNLIECKLDNPLVNSHHDLLLSKWFLPDVDEKESNNENVIAPIAENNRLKVTWSDFGIQEYQNLVVPHLSRLQDLWLSSKSTKTAASLLLESTNNLLTSSAAMTNRTTPLDQFSSRTNPAFTRRNIRLSKNALLKQNKILNKALLRENTEHNVDIYQMKSDYNKARNLHRKLERAFKAKNSIQRDQTLYSVRSSDPSPVFNSVKHYKRSKSGKIFKLIVGSKNFVGESVKD